MNLFKQYQQVITIGLVVIAGFVAYSVFFKPTNENALTAQTVDPSKTAVEQELIALLIELRSIKLDTAVFGDERFKALQDFSQQIVQEPIGRENPFAPLGQK